MTAYWLSGPFCTVQCNVDDRGTVLWTAPIARKFIGQPMWNLTRWMRADWVLELELFG